MGYPNALTLLFLSAGLYSLMYLNGPAPGNPGDQGWRYTTRYRKNHRRTALHEATT